MAATEKNIIAGILTFIFYGLIPCALLLWIMGRNHRHFKQHQASLNQEDVPASDADLASGESPASADDAHLR